MQTEHLSDVGILAVSNCTFEVPCSVIFITVYSLWSCAFLTLSSSDACVHGKALSLSLQEIKSFFKGPISR